MKPTGVLRELGFVNINNNIKKMSSFSARTQPVSQSRGAVVLAGHLKKLKTLKKKYFVLRAEAIGHPACLEYYDNKKKYDNKQPPKRSISVRSCFNINKRRDTKHKHVIALYTKDDCFCLVLDNEKDLEEWLKNLLLLQNGDQPDGEQPRPTFEHIWQVIMKQKGLGEKKNIVGPYRLCLTDRVLSLVKLGSDDKNDSIEFSLSCIRRSGCIERIFYMEVGRSALTGGGEFWMEAEDSNIAQNMQLAINNAMTNSSTAKDEGPKQRLRSSSANEASKPISVLQRRHTAQKLHSFSPLEEQRMHEDQVDTIQEQNVTASAPSQCSQTQTTSTSNSQMGLFCHSSLAVGVTESGTIGTIACTKSTTSIMNRRRHSVASHPIPSVNNNISQSNHVNATSSSSATSTTSTATISHQRTLSLPLAASAINQTQSSKRSMLRCMPISRDRCDSLPSRARTTSEGCCPTSTITTTAVALSQQSRTSHLVPSHMGRPHSMHSKVLSYSPPVNLSMLPMSPISAPCSTDSAGSSLSMDDTSENIDESILAKYGHSLTPDDPPPMIQEEDYVPWSAGQTQKFSPNFKSCSPSQQSSYVEMYSPCNSSPGRSNYLPMSPATGVHSHSRASSLVEESNTLPDGYVPMAPVSDHGYVDMDPVHHVDPVHHMLHNGHFPDDLSTHGGSSCSITSGTPSTDLRFSEYHLDKVTSFLAPGEDLQMRPSRAFSLGSKPELINRHRKNRLDITQQEASRVRAFSVGSRCKKPEIRRLVNIVTAPLVSGIENTNSNKSNSAPLLSSSWGHNSGCSMASERMEDLMELDFSRSNVPVTLSSPPSSYSQSQSYSTATDTSSYVDMSPGQPPKSTTAPYVDMNGPSKINRINNNSNNNMNNNNITTANHNHNQNHAMMMISSHKPVITQISSTLKPVEETESAYMKMDKTPEDTWSSHSRISPKQVPSPCQDDYMQMNGPPGGTRTAPMDLPQPRRPVEGYVEMSFKGKPSLEQDYTNMGPGRGHRRHNHHYHSRKKKSSLPIAIQASGKLNKTPNFLPLNGESPTSESLESTPASPPRATPTGSSNTIFPFSLNSPQSPIKPFTTSQTEKSSLVKIEASISKNESGNTAPPTTRKISAPSPLPGVDGCPSSKKVNDTQDSHFTPNVSTRQLIVSGKQVNNPTAVTPSTTKSTTTVSTNDKPMLPKSSTTVQSQESTLPMSITKKLSDLTVSKPRLVTASPTSSPTPLGFKPVQVPTSTMPKPASPKIIDDTTPACTPTPTPTSTPTPSPLDSEGYEKLQPGANRLHYASLDLPEVLGAPVSPIPVPEGFSYAEIDFAAIKPNENSLA